MQTGIGRFDYASFLIDCDEQQFQAHWLNEWNTIVANRMSESDRKRFQRVHPLGAIKGGRRRYVLTLAGQHAELVRNLPFEKWADQLTRLDIRSVLYECRPDTYEKLCVALEHAETRNNIETFKVASRTKNHQRDTGGRGVRYGSRKSDVSTKVYRRGKELPVVETQIQDDKLDELVLACLELTLECDNSFNYWSVLAVQCCALQYKHINNWLRQSGSDHDIDGLRDEQIPMPEALRKMYQEQMFWGGEPPKEDPDQSSVEPPADFVPF